MAQTRRQSSEGILGGLPFVRGAAHGALAWLIGFVSFVVLINVVEADDAFTGDWWQMSGIIFHNAHYVDASDGSVSLNFLHGDIAQLFTDWTIPAIGYTLIVVVLLVAAGHVLVSNRSTSDANGAAAGATLALGYLPLALLGSFVFDADGASPELLTSIVIMGLFFPAVFGAIGGYVAGLK